jgi:LytS/YehU family sensor histidine kinase
MILQPLIENAVKYCGIDKETTPFCTIWVDVTVKENSIIVGVENTIGINETPLISGSGAGLRLVAEKIDIFNKTYNRKISMNLETELIHCKTGYRVELRF